VVFKDSPFTMNVNSSQGTSSSKRSIPSFKIAWNGENLTVWFEDGSDIRFNVKYLSLNVHWLFKDEIGIFMKDHQWSKVSFPLHPQIDSSTTTILKKNRLIRQNCEGLISNPDWFAWYKCSSQYFGKCRCT
jgi:hypothetical protein